jgi:hypothetical protein
MGTLEDYPAIGNQDLGQRTAMSRSFPPDCLDRVNRSAGGTGSDHKGARQARGMETGHGGRCRETEAGMNAIGPI